MGPVYYVIAIMGCGDGNAACVPAKLEAARYQSLAQCRAAMPDVLSKQGDLSFPVVTGSCRPAGEQMAAIEPVRPRR